MVQPLDYEKQKLYNFVISANFTDGVYALADVEVIVEDVNDVCPKFTSSEYIVYHTEPMAKDLLVAVTSINDPDTVGSILYTMTGNNKFTIDNKGYIWTNTLINDNVTKLPELEYNLNVIVTDGVCSDTTRIRVVASKILIHNYLLEPYYLFEISENQPAPFEVDKFTNKGGFADAKYYLLEVNEHFEMNADTGN